MSTLTDIAQAVAGELAGGTFAVAFTPRYRDLVDFTPEQLAAVEVSVVPAGITTARHDRHRRALEYQVDVAIQKRVDPHSQAETFPLHQLAEDIDSFLFDRPLAAVPEARWLKSELLTPAHPQHLDELHVFTSVARFTYRICR